ncbi:MAG: hypothetical protein HYX67_16325 [Candidatus Melainabacteria bacterium]|nr:hypothetical protein [Candidatus Melainabacteria bacterium]
MLLLERLRRNPVQGTLLLSICAVHIVFLLIILIHPAFAMRKKEHKPLIVKTVARQSAPKVAAQEKKSSPPALKQAPIPVAAPAPKIQTPTPTPVPAPAPKVQTPTPVQPKAQAPAAKKVVPKTDPVKKEAAIADKRIAKTAPPPTKKAPLPRAKISDSLLKELEESIAKIEKSSDKGVASKRTPTIAKAAAPITLQIDIPFEKGSNAEEGEEDYTDTLIRHLHQSLSLPDYGEVKIQLSLRQDGSVAKIVVLTTQSEKNKRYLESILPSLRFPRFDGVFASKKEHTFTLTFCNEL